MALITKIKGVEEISLAVVDEIVTCAQVFLVYHGRCLCTPCFEITLTEP